MSWSRFFSVQDHPDIRTSRKQFFFAVSRLYFGKNSRFSDAVIPGECAGYYYYLLAQRLWESERVFVTVVCGPNIAPRPHLAPLIVGYFFRVHIYICTTKSTHSTEANEAMLVPPPLFLSLFEEEEEEERIQVHRERHIWSTPCKKTRRPTRGTCVTYHVFSICRFISRDLQNIRGTEKHYRFHPVLTRMLNFFLIFSSHTSACFDV